jgi:hypothetical protein
MDGGIFPRNVQRINIHGGKSHLLERVCGTMWIILFFICSVYQTCDGRDNLTEGDCGRIDFGIPLECNDSNLFFISEVSLKAIYFLLVLKSMKDIFSRPLRVVVIYV